MKKIFLLFSMVTDFSVFFSVVWSKISYIGETIFLSKMVQKHLAAYEQCLRAQALCRTLVYCVLSYSFLLLLLFLIFLSLFIPSFLHLSSLLPLFRRGKKAHRPCSVYFKSDSKSKSYFHENYDRQTSQLDSFGLQVTSVRRP